ncbi:MAG: carboxypeptidase-like regulatory domain-containing protein [Planctomycetaceae bacterium]|nr:carboxypeptidase regulatory-like domain-containing protein [Planctomycetaceae bacterium]
MRNFVVCCIGLLLVLPGCGGTSLPATVSVSGIVTFNGEPLADATVVFYPAEGKPATGKTGPDGVYKLTTFQADDGALPGKHKVAISKSSAAPESNSPEDMAKIKREIPDKYSNADTSGLTADVQVGQTADIDFNLAD